MCAERGRGAGCRSAARTALGRLSVGVPPTHTLSDTRGVLRHSSAEGRPLPPPPCRRPHDGVGLRMAVARRTRFYDAKVRPTTARHGSWITDVITPITDVAPDVCALRADGFPPRGAARLFGKRKMIILWVVSSAERMRVGFSRSRRRGRVPRAGSGYTIRPLSLGLSERSAHKRCHESWKPSNT